MQETDSQSGATERRGEEIADLGARLRSERKRQNLSLEQIAEELRLEPRVLHALEDERFDDLVAPVFARGYLRQYGKKLGLDCEGLLRDYERLTERTHVELEPPASVAARSMEPGLNRRWLFAALIVIFVAVAGAGLVWWFGGLDGFAERFGLASSSTNPAALPYPAASTNGAEPEAALLREDTRITAPVLAVERASDAPSLAEFLLGRESDQPHAADPANVAGPVDVGDQAGLADPTVQADRQDSSIAADGVDAAATADSATAVDDLSGHETVEAALTFVQDSWAEVTDARGVRLVYELGFAGEERAVVGAAPVDFLFGNAAGVALVIDGEPFAIPRSDSPGTVVGFTVEASGD